MTFRHSHHENGILKSDRLNACFQFSEPRIGSCEWAFRITEVVISTRQGDPFETGGGGERGTGLHKLNPKKVYLQLHLQKE